jgi:hypothetical protein
MHTGLDFKCYFYGRKYDFAEYYSSHLLDQLFEMSFCKLCSSHSGDPVLFAVHGSLAHTYAPIIIHCNIYFAF